MRTVAELATHLPLSSEDGLTPEAVPRSQELFGRNGLTPPPTEPAWRKFLDKFDDPIIKTGKLGVDLAAAPVAGACNAEVLIVRVLVRVVRRAPEPRVYR